MRPVSIAYRIVRYSGLPFLFREVLFRRAKRIVMFHNPMPDAFDRAVAYLAKRYSIITLDDHLSGRPLPPKPLVITFDDGHIGNHALLPVFRKHGIRPSIFLCAEIVGTRRHFWFSYAARTASSGPLKLLPDHDRLLALQTLGFWPEREFDTPEALQEAHIREMREHVDFQSHGLSHALLPNCTDQVAQRELTESKHLLEGLLGTSITAFAFPNGDYCERDIRLAREAGYRCALTVDFGFNRRGADPFRLKRLSVDDSGDIDALSTKVSGVWALLNAIIGKRTLSRAKRQPAFTAVPALAAQLVLCLL